MRPHFSDPEARAILHERKQARDAEWLKRQIGEATYLRSLMILGYPLDEARMELNHLRTSHAACGALELSLEGRGGAT